MFSRFFILAVSIATIHAQISDEIRREASHLDDLVNSGQYAKATRLAESILKGLHLRQRDDLGLVFLAYLGKSAVEQGQPGLAFRIFKSADALNRSTFTRDRYYEPVLVREKAALSYAAGEYGAAAELAAQAYRESVDRKYYSIRAEYCNSMQALALLRSGRLAEAERLALIAAKAVPKKAGNKPGFAPRILSAACIVTAHTGRFADAEAFCRRGLDAALSAKMETRDLSLGHLAFAEYWLQTGDLVRSRESADRAAHITKELFGTQHQDMVEALVILASIDRRQGTVDTARSRVNEAVRIAAALFGEGSTAATLPARALGVEIPKNR